jgi:hypothetical protein
MVRRPCNAIPSGRWSVVDAGTGFKYVAGQIKGPTDGWRAGSIHRWAFFLIPKGS